MDDDNGDDEEQEEAEEMEAEGLSDRSSRSSSRKCKIRHLLQRRSSAVGIEGSTFMVGPPFGCDM